MVTLFKFSQINMDFEMMFPDKSDELLTKWDTFYRDRVVAVGVQESDAVRELIKSFENQNSEYVVTVYSSPNINYCCHNKTCNNNF